VTRANGRRAALVAALLAAGAAGAHDAPRTIPSGVAVRDGGAGGEEGGDERRAAAVRARHRKLSSA